METDGKMVIVVAPSGAGKSSFVERITREMPVLKDTITYTTRNPRTGESHGDPYFFVSPVEFDKLRDSGFFVEWAQVHANFYGTPMNQITDGWKEGRVLIMDVDVQGAQTFQRKFKGARTIFILPPSIQELKRRILGRDGRVPDDLELRLTNADTEMALAHIFDYQIVNDDFERSYQEFKKIVEDIVRAK
jgi:guanylate kinase